VLFPAHWIHNQIRISWSAPLNVSPRRRVDVREGCRVGGGATLFDVSKKEADRTGNAGNTAITYSVRANGTATPAVPPSNVLLSSSTWRVLGSL
jgi:hypothetical protein